MDRPYWSPARGDFSLWNNSGALEGVETGEFSTPVTVVTIFAFSLLFVTSSEVSDSGNGR
jgi:hypothetical protein